MSTLVKKSEFAAIRRCSPSYVTKLVNADRLVLSPDGKKIDLEASIRKLDDTADLQRTGLREHHERERVVRDALRGSETAPLQLGPAGASSELLGDPGGDSAPSAAKAAGDSNYERYNAARAEGEQERARIARLNRMKQEGELVEAAGVRRMATGIADMIRNGLQTLRPRLVPLLAAESDPIKCDQLLASEIAKLLTDLADAVGKLAPSDA